MPRAGRDGSWRPRHVRMTFLFHGELLTVSYRAAVAGLEVVLQVKQNVLWA